jgi:hypothetical protein
MIVYCLMQLSHLCIYFPSFHPTTTNLPSYSPKKLSATITTNEHQQAYSHKPLPPNEQSPNEHNQSVGIKKVAYKRILKK